MTTVHVQPTSMLGQNRDTISLPVFRMGISGTPPQQLPKSPRKEGAGNMTWYLGHLLTVQPQPSKPSRPTTRQWPSGSMEVEASPTIRWTTGEVRPPHLRQWLTSGSGSWQIPAVPSQDNLYTALIRHDHCSRFHQTIDLCGAHSTLGRAYGWGHWEYAC